MGKNTETSNFRVCKHGSSFCAICFHNTASAISLPGRPKYGPKVSKSNKPKSVKTRPEVHMTA